MKKRFNSKQTLLLSFMLNSQLAAIDVSVQSANGQHTVHYDDIFLAAVDLHTHFWHTTTVHVAHCALANDTVMGNVVVPGYKSVCVMTKR